MKEVLSYLQMAFAAMGGWLGWFFGGLDGFLYALITFVVVDYVTGVMVAIIDKRLSSDIGARGIFKKVLIFNRQHRENQGWIPASFSPKGVGRFSQPNALDNLVLSVNHW
ncbi:MAG: phage holin family protein [Firmicutes bacterium]|nr:phage holin family protein [Bacillota bacterium]